MALIAKVNKEGKGIAQPIGLGPYSFRPNFKGFRFRSFKGVGAKGFGGAFGGRGFGAPYRTNFGLARPKVATKEGVQKVFPPSPRRAYGRQISNVFKGY